MGHGEKDYFIDPEVADLFGVKKATLQKWICIKKPLPKFYYAVSGERRWPKAEVIEFKKQHERLVQHG